MHRLEQDYKDCLQDCIVTQALSGLCVGLVLTDPRERVIWLNRAAERVLGTSAADALGRQLGGLLRDLQLLAFWQDSAATNGNVLADVGVTWPENLSLKVNATRYVDRHGDEVGRALLFCDVTAERAVQVELSEEVANRLLTLTAGQMRAEPVANLTQQEMRVLRLVGRGLGNDEIGEELGISPSTVRSHLKGVYRKLQLNSRAEAVSYAARNHPA